jgi:hypothetical protein
MEKPLYPLVYGGDAPNVSASFTSEQSRYVSMIEHDYDTIFTLSGMPFIADLRPNM